MSQPFPEHAYLSGNFAPVHVEGVARDLPVKGEIPKELRGSLYRNGPNPRFAPRDAYHWFAGDGMVHAFHIADGRVDYQNRWVRTPRWQLEDEAGENLFGALGNPMTSDERVQGLDGGVANTNIVWHGGDDLEWEPVAGNVEFYLGFPGGAEWWSSRMSLDTRFTTFVEEEILK